MTNLRDSSRQSSPWHEPTWWSGTRAPIEAASGLHPDAYASPAFFADEQASVFERAWVCIGVSPEVAETGRAIVRTVGSRSIIVTRDGNGVLRGFINACRHRGTELLAEDCELAGTIRCPYHRWGYGLDGTLISTPMFDEVPRADFDKTENGLIQVRVETWGCLVFACLDDATPPLATWLGDLDDRMAGYHLDTWHTRYEQTLDIESNWKLISENFQEYYHLSWVHPELAKVSRVEDHYRYQGRGMYCGQTTTPVSGDERDEWLSLPSAAGLDESDAVSGRFVAIFPNVLVSVLPNHVFVMRLEPIAPGVTHEVCTWLLPESSRNVADEAFESTRTFWLDVNSEDIAICERSQRGLARGGVPAGSLAPRFEEPLNRFHNMLADHLTGASLSELVVPPGDVVGDARQRFGSGTNPHPARIDVDGESRG